MTLLAGLLAWILWLQLVQTRRQGRTDDLGTRELPAKSGKLADALPSKADVFRGRLLQASEELKSKLDPASSRQTFANLGRTIAGLPPKLAAQEITKFLDSGVDAPSHLGFSIGADGFLSEYPSLRVYLLDYLARLNRAAAAAYAQKILGTYNSAEEWAVSLRNYALGSQDPTARAFLQQKFGDMLRFAAWRQNPSDGFLEAFDVAVYTGGTDLIPDLASLVRQTENPAIAHAAYVALDRLTIRDPAAVLAKLQEEPELMAGREIPRASYFARADVADIQQRTIVERYLLDPRRSEKELEKFAGLFPSGNFMVSHNLLTRMATPSGYTISQQDREALKVINGWLEDARFEKVKPRLQEIKNRLGNFVE